MIAGNKCDLEDMREVSAQDLRVLAERERCPWIETSVKDRINVDEVFEMCVREVERPRRVIGPLERRKACVLS